jgi:hypothetical protein
VADKVNTPTGQTICAESIMGYLMSNVASANIYRALAYRNKENLERGWTRSRTGVVLRTSRVRFLVAIHYFGNSSDPMQQQQQQQQQQQLAALLQQWGGGGYGGGGQAGGAPSNSTTVGLAAALQQQQQQILQQQQQQLKHQFANLFITP